MCETFATTYDDFLTVRVTEDCEIIYITSRLGKQYGQLWLMDRHQNQTLSRSLIAIQIHVLRSVDCDIPPELKVKSQQDHLNRTTVKINQSIYVSVSTDPHCPLIDPQDQTITELTTLCTNSQPVILSNGGIQMQFQCKPSLCERYQVCFVGEFSMKLQSTKTECLAIDVIGTGTFFLHRTRTSREE